jgi:putative intracellular protease/amidase
MAHQIVMPLPAHDFDPTETAVPWHIFQQAGADVTFSTPEGVVGQADPLVVNGVIFGQLGAEPEPVRLYNAMTQAPAFQKPVPWDKVDANMYDALFLPGGHAQGMKPYLESPEVQALALAMWKAGKPVAAICHGVIVLARTIDPDTKLSVLAGRKTTCLPKYMEQIAYYITAWKLGGYYRTYPAYVEEEVRQAVGTQGTFVRGPIHLFSRGTESDDRAAVVVEDKHYLSARWPGDAYLIAKRLLHRLDQLLDFKAA